MTEDHPNVLMFLCKRCGHPAGAHGTAGGTWTDKKTGLSIDWHGFLGACTLKGCECRGFEQRQEDADRLKAWRAKQKA